MIHSNGFCNPPQENPVVATKPRGFSFRRGKRKRISDAGGRVDPSGSTRRLEGWLAVAAACVSGSLHGARESQNGRWGGGGWRAGWRWGVGVGGVVWGGGGGSGGRGD